MSWERKSEVMMTPEQAVGSAILTCLAGALVALLCSRSKTLAGWASFVATAASAALIGSAVWNVLSRGPSSHPAVFWTVPRFGLVLRMYVDGLSAIFLLLAVLIAVSAALYSISYMRHYSGYGVVSYYPNFLLFVGAIYGLLSTTDMMWFFFLFWQLMTLPSYALIRFEYRKPQNVRAANKYLIMMQVACLTAMIGTQLLVRNTPNAGGLKYDFDTVSAALPSLLSHAPGLAAVAFLFFLVGFGIKAGMWPFGQLWLPDAHPAAPSPVSSMLSGVMIKTGIYGLLRYFLWLVPSTARADYPLASWGMLVAILGTITLFTGTMQALKQEQTKRLLAFHSIGQIGYILLASGACMTLLAAGTPIALSLATLALFGAVLHVLNHGLFKGLLFLNAGSMLHATDTQNLNQLGGLMKYMPLTATTALIASFSISGVPLFNGFVSKWTIYVVAIQGSAYARYLPACALIAILTSVLTLASFIKFFGASFLCRSSELVRTRAKSGTLEVGWLMQAPQVLLASLCILLGVAPALGFGLLQRGIENSPQGFGADLAANEPLTNGVVRGVSLFTSAAVLVPVVLAAVLLVMFLLAYFVARLGESPHRAAEPWLCGYARENAWHRYVAHNFYGEIKRYFRWIRGSPGMHVNGRST
jgi:hydrogenase-4 component B